MFLRILDKGLLDSNTYIIGSKGEAAVIDPGNPVEDIISQAEEAGYKITYIILTHTHFDHIKNVDELRSRTGARVLAHKLEERGFSDPFFNGSKLGGINRTFQAPDMLVEDNDKINIGDLTLEFIHTPGHTPGSMCIKVDNMLFTGDTVFYDDFGRTDLGFGSPEQLRASIGRIFSLDHGIMVYPGHYQGDKLGNIIKRSKAAYDFI